MTPLLQALIRRLYPFLYDRLYNELAFAYDWVSWLVSFGQWDRWRRSALQFVQGEQVLEVGFGTGELLYLLAIKAKKTVGLDASAAMHDITAAKLRKRHLRVPQIQGVAQQLPFADGCFDAVVATFPAGFILDPTSHAEFTRVLRPGGRLIVVDVHLASRNRAFRWLFGLAFPPSPESARRYRKVMASSPLAVTHHTLGEGAVQVMVTVGEKLA